MAKKRGHLSKTAQSAITKAVKRAKLTQSELHRRSWIIPMTGTGLLQIGGTPTAMWNGSTTNFLLNASLQGTGSDQRIGNQVKESGLRLKGMIMHMSTVAGEICNCVRIVVVRDHDNKSVLPLASDVFENSSAPECIGSLVKWSNRKRFTFVYDQVFALQAQAAETGLTSACVPVDIDLRGTHGVDNLLTYNANDYTSGSLQQKGLYCFMMADTLVAAPTTFPYFIGSASFFFHDN